MSYIKRLIEDAYEMHEDGYKNDEIAERLGIPVDDVVRAIDICTDDDEEES